MMWTVKAAFGRTALARPIHEGIPRLRVAGGLPVKLLVAFMALSGSFSALAATLNAATPSEEEALPLTSAAPRFALRPIGRDEARGLQGVQKATTPNVSPMRCRTLSEWTSISCPSISDTAPKASLTDYGIGGYVEFDGETERYVVDHLDPDGVAGYATTFSLGGAPCAQDEYSYFEALTTQCTYGGIYHVRLYPHTKLGQWKMRVQAGTAASMQVVYLGPVEVVYATMEKMDGDGQQGVINQALRKPLVVAVKDFAGTEVRYPIRGITGAEITTTLSGPRNAGGSVAFTDYDPAHVTRHRYSLTLGSKEGTYQVTFKNRDTQTSAPFSAIAKLREEPEDDEDKEEENGEEDPCESVGDPISLSTGNMWLPQTDYAQAGLSPIEFRRTYNSQGSKSKLTGTLWSTTYDRFVIPATNGGPVRLRRPDGRTIRFTVGQGGLTPQPHFLGRLQQTAAGWRYVDEDQTVEEFDTQGRLLRITDLQGRTVSTSYNTQGAMSGVTSNAGGSLTFTYTSTFGQLNTVRDHTGRTWTYAYDNYANLLSVLQPDGYQVVYEYTDPRDPHKLTKASMQYPGGGSLPFAVWDYDAQGRATTSYAPGSLSSSTPRRRVTIEYPSDTLRRVTDGGGNVTEYSVTRTNGTGFISSVVGPGFSQCGLADTVREFDPAMNVTTLTRFGRTTRFGNFDEKRQPGFMVEADGTLKARRTDYIYDPRFIGRPTLITEPSVAVGRTKTTLIDYNARGQATRVAVSGYRPDGTAVSSTTTAEYNGPLGQLSKVDGPRTDVLDVTTYTYDPVTQRLRSVRDAAGVDVRSNILFNPLGQIASESRPNGVNVTYAYVPGSALLASVTEQAGGVMRRTAWTYTIRQEVQSITFSDGVNPDQAVHFQYDYAGDLIYAGARRSYEPNAIENYIEFTRDGAGNVTTKQIRDGWENSWAYDLDTTFDAYNRVDALVAANNIVDLDFHPDGTLTQETDGRSQTTTYGYDDFARLTHKLQPGAAPTSIDYDVHGRQDFVGDANQAETRFEFDDLGNSLAEHSPDRGTTRRTYDTASNILSTTDANGQLATFAYDMLNRIRTVDRAGTEYDETYSYSGCVNGVGRLCRITTSNGEVVDFEYDPFGSISKLTNNGISVGYVYDGAGKVVSIIYPSGRTVHYVHDVHGQVAAVSVSDGGTKYNLAAGVRHKPFGPVSGWNYGNGLIHSRTYDNQYWPRSIDTPGVSRVNLSTYDGNGNLKSQTIDSTTQRFEYDVWDQISSGTGLFGVRTFVHDAVGNRQSMTAEGVPTSYGYDSRSNRLATETGWSYERDANGNTRSKRSTDGLNRGWSYEYSPHNRLVAVFDLQSPSLPVGEYRYNGLAQRSQKVAGGTTTRFVYGLSPLLLSELVGGGVRQEYVYLDGQPLALLGVPQPPAPPPPTYSFDVVVDNATASGDWLSLSDNKATGGSYLYIDQARQQSVDSHTWQWTIPVTGIYRIKVRWVPPTKATITSQSYSVSAFPGSIYTVSGVGVARGSWPTVIEGYFKAGTVELRLTEADNPAKQLFADAAQMTLLEARPTIPGRDYAYVHTDHLGTPIAVTDKDKRVVWRSRYDPFGAATTSLDPDSDGVPFALELRFPGQYADRESGLHYNYYRNYDPAAGRYLTGDPIGLAGGLNNFSYASGNPITHADPWGLYDIYADARSGSYLGERAYSLQFYDGFGGWAGTVRDWRQALSDSPISPGGPLFKALEAANNLRGQPTGVSDLLDPAHRAICDSNDTRAREIYEEMFGKHSRTSTLKESDLIKFINAVNADSWQVERFYPVDQMLQRAADRAHGARTE